MIRLGIVDFDTSHVIEFTKRINHVDVAQDQWVNGAKVVAGCPGTSIIYPERVAGYRDQMKKYDIPLFDKPSDLIGKVDAVLIESNEGAQHLAHAKVFLEAGIPCFVDKPFANSVADAKAMAELAAKKKVLLWSTSSLRFTPELVAHLADTKPGQRLGAYAYGPGNLHDRNPGFFHYGIHPVEILYTLMGTGCERVTCSTTASATVATGVWKNGRVGTIRANRGTPSAYGFTSFGEKAITQATCSMKTMYKDMLTLVVKAFEDKKAPVEISTTVEIVAFIEAANKSSDNHGSVQTVVM